jgi:Ribbon-helix-helix protein, copG family
VVSFRIPWDELEELDEAATAEGESLSEFIRKAVRFRLAGIAIAPFVEMTYGGARDVRLRTDIPVWLRGTEASVPDKPFASDWGLAGTAP